MRWIELANGVISSLVLSSKTFLFLFLWMSARCCLVVFIAMKPTAIFQLVLWSNRKCLSIISIFFRGGVGAKEGSSYNTQRLHLGDAISKRDFGSSRKFLILSQHLSSSFLDEKVFNTFWYLSWNDFFYIQHDGLWLE